MILFLLMYWLIHDNSLIFVSWDNKILWITSFLILQDDNFERLFQMYADKVKSTAVESLVFIFDGDKVSPAATPEGLGLEDGDMIEVHLKSM